MIQSQAGAAVTTDGARNRFFTIYLSGLAAAGLGLFAATYTLDWGFWGWFGGTLLLFAGGGGLASKAKTGGAGKVSCPSCGGPIEVLHISMHRILPCPHCQHYLEGAETMSVVPEDRVAPHAAFVAALPDPFRWPSGCPVCREPATGTKKVEGRSFAGAFALVAAPVALARVNTVDAPCCNQHDDGVALHREDGGTFISFRSFRYFQEFCALNGVAPAASTGAGWQRDAHRSLQH